MAVTNTALQGWNQAYQYNLRLYNARVHSYKAGNPNAKNMTDEEAVRYCEEFSIPMPHVGGVDSELANDQDAIAEQLQESVPIPEPIEEPTKTPKPKASRKRKSEVEPAQPAVAPAAPAAAPSPDKKRKRTSTKPVEQPEKDEPKKSGRKKAKSG
jgi:hypothetical protein